jgi:APA family basic amino acid/polyamine antiporter
MQDMGDAPKKSLGLLDATLLVAGSMIGSGIFIVSSIMMNDIGSPAWMLVLWILTGLITILAALSYGELAGMMPNAGGQYVYIQRAFGRLPSFLYGWTVFTVIQTGVIAAVAVAFAKYTAVFFPGLNDVIVDLLFLKLTYAHVVAIASVLLLTYSNSQGLQNGKIIQFIFTSAKLFALFALIVLGIYLGIKSNVFELNMTDAWTAFKTTRAESGAITKTPLLGWALVGALGATIINSLFSADAWNNVTFIAGEIRDPKRNIPRSLFFGTLIVTLIYVLANVAYLMLLPNQDIMNAPSNRVGAAAAHVIFGEPGVLIMAGLIMVSTFGCNNGLILAGSRLYHAMAKDGLFFKKANKLNTHGIPSAALWIQCLWASVLCLSGKYEDLLTYSTFASLLFYVLTIAGIFRLRKTEPDTPRPYRAFGYPILPMLYIAITSAICLILLVYSPLNTLIGLFIVALGIPVYFLTAKRQ